MRDTKSHRKLLLLQGDLLPEQFFNGISGAVADCKDNRFRGDPLNIPLPAFLRRGKGADIQTADPAALPGIRFRAPFGIHFRICLRIHFRIHFRICCRICLRIHFRIRCRIQSGLLPGKGKTRAQGLKAHFPACLLDPLADLGDHPAQSVRAYMRFSFIQNRFRSACPDKSAQYLHRAAGAVIDLGVQLAVRECPGAALSELYVRGSIQNTGLPILLDICGAVFHLPAALDDKRPISVLSQKQGAEQTCRTCADDNRPVGQLFTSARRKSIAVRRCRSHIFVPEAPHQRGLLFRAGPQVNIYRVHIKKLRLFARVDRVTYDVEGKGPVL